MTYRTSSQFDIDRSNVRPFEDDLRGMDLEAIDKALDEVRAQITPLEEWAEALAAQQRLLREAGR